MTDLSADDQPGRFWPQWASRWVVIALFLWILGFLAYSLYRSRLPVENEQKLISPFRQWDGVWEGETVTTDVLGKEVRRIRERREFRHVPPKMREMDRSALSGEFRQEGHFYATDPATGKQALARVLHSSDFKRNHLRSRVYEDNGRGIIEREGRLKGDHVIWTRLQSTATVAVSETIEEWIDGEVYSADGELHRSMQVQSGDSATSSTSVFKTTGRYTRVKE